MTRSQKAKQNRAVTSSEERRARKVAADWHWFPQDEFEQKLQLIDWPDPDYPPGALVRCGNLVQLHFRAPPKDKSSRHPRRQRDTTIKFSVETARKSHLTFDPENTSDDRLYLVIQEPVALRGLASRFWSKNPISPRPLSEWAVLAGGRHAKRAGNSLDRGGYPHVMGKPIGVLTALAYFTNKKDDGPSYYLHKMGEVSGVYPLLVCDSQGRLWVCGGNYQSPTPGITD
jgi:hypothetical protein